MPGNFSFLSKHCHHLNWYFSYLSFSFEIQVIKKSLSWNYKKFAFFNHHCLSCFQLVLIKTSSLNKCEQKKNNCVGRESNPDQLLGRQLCWPLYHRRLMKLHQKIKEITIFHISIIGFIWYDYLVSKTNWKEGSFYFGFNLNLC